MKLRIRQLIGLIAVATFVSAGCKQEKSPPDGQFTARSIGSGTDPAALAETIVTLLFIARKQARDTGECAQGEQPLDRRSVKAGALKRLLCDRLTRQEAKRSSSEQDLRWKSVAGPPKG
jgi:hypothetical protein